MPLIPQRLIIFYIIRDVRNSYYMCKIKYEFWYYQPYVTGLYLTFSPSWLKALAPVNSSAVHQQIVYHSQAVFEHCAPTGHAQLASCSYTVHVALANWSSDVSSFIHEFIHSYKWQEQTWYQLQKCCCLSGIMVSMLAIGPKVHRFKPGWGDGFLGVIKICSMPSFRGEVKPLAPWHKCLRHVKNLAQYERDTASAKFKDVSRQIPASLLDVCAVTRECWWMHQDWLELRWEWTVELKMAALHGMFWWFHPITVTSIIPSNSGLLHWFDVSKQMMSAIIPEVCTPFITELEKYIQVRNL
jgi:hypothetical protein